MTAMTNTIFDDLYLRLPATDSGQLPLPAVVGLVEDQGCCPNKPCHRHGFYEIAWLTSGEATFVCDFVEYPVSAGTLIFITPGQVHRWKGDLIPSALYVCGFRPDLFLNSGLDAYRLLSSLPFYNVQSMPFVTLTAEQYPLVQGLFEAAYRTFQARKEHTDERLSAFLNVILTEAKTLCSASGESPIPAAQNLVRKFHQAIQQHYLERLRVQDYAAMLGVTTSHLVETVRQATGMTPGEMLHNRLVLEAKRMLVYSDYSAAEIALKLSFSSASHFGQWFRKMTDLTPREFRETFQNP